MTEQGKLRFCEEFNLYLINRFGYKKKTAYISHDGRTITAKRKLFDLYFRWLPGNSDWGMNTLVVARIHFHQTRVGHGSALINFLVEQAPCYGYQQIAIEYANSNSAAFAQRQGFTNKAGTRDWIKKIPS